MALLSTFFTNRSQPPRTHVLLDRKHRAPAPSLVPAGLARRKARSFRKGRCKKRELDELEHERGPTPPRERGTRNPSPNAATAEKSRCSRRGPAAPVRACLIGVGNFGS